jgi:hypothetical protein
LQYMKYRNGFRKRGHEEGQVGESREMGFRPNRLNNIK